MACFSGHHKEALHRQNRRVFIFGRDYFRTRFVHDIIRFVNGNIVVVGITQEVPTSELGGIAVIIQFNDAIAAVRRAGEGECTRSLAGVEVALAGLEVEVAIVTFEVDPFQILGLVEIVEVCCI